jgi:NAD-dependent deacetylase
MIAPSIVILTGAGISAESGIQTFRDNGDGSPALWADHDVEDVATPAGYRRDKNLVHEFYTERRRAAAEALPNAAHEAIGRLGDALGDRLLVATQNVDDLHERGGLDPDLLVHMHGFLRSALCPACGERELDGVFGTLCPVCRIGELRPDVVWFGEHPYQMGRIEQAVERADLFVAIGTSGQVYPAAGLVDIARLAGVSTFELNLHPTHAGFDAVMEGPATVVVPGFVDSLIAASR